jgi:acrylyl-CoA reductase (NADPH)
MSEQFKALVLDQKDDNVTASIKELTTSDLPEGEVLVRVAYSSLNYKDGLAITNKAKVVRSFPMVPGIDFAGTVVESSVPEYKTGDEVILTGWFVGERYWGGMAQMTRVKAGWLVPLPAGLSLQHAMAVGTAGFTAALAIMALEEQGLQAGERQVAVSGASGGVGSMAVAMLARRGYNVVASTGRSAEAAYLRELGAAEIIDRETLAAPSKRPLESERWAGAVDTVGGETLAGLLRTMAYGSSVAACGNAGGNAFSTTVLPFILRGVNLLGIDSVSCPPARRQAAWQRIAEDLPGDMIERMSNVAGLSDLPRLAAEITSGQVRGRTVIDVNK